MSSIQNLLGLHPTAEAIASYVSSLCTDAAEAEVKSYSDAVYFNYYALGLSLLFAPKNGYKPTTGLVKSALRNEDLVLEGIDLYNTPAKPQAKANSGRKAELAFSTFPGLPLTLNLSVSPTDKDGQGNPRASQLTVNTDTTGKDFVACLGEPTRKGGGAGPSSGSIGIWCEWTRDGVMVEFGGDEAKGPQAWERGKDAGWRVLSIVSYI